MNALICVMVGNNVIVGNEALLKGKAKKRAWWQRHKLIERERMRTRKLATERRLRLEKLAAENRLRRRELRLIFKKLLIRQEEKELAAKKRRWGELFPKKSSDSRRTLKKIKSPDSPRFRQFVRRFKSCGVYDLSRETAVYRLGRSNPVFREIVFFDRKGVNKVRVEMRSKAARGYRRDLFSFIERLKSTALSKYGVKFSLDNLYKKFDVLINTLTSKIHVARAVSSPSTLRFYINEKELRRHSDGSQHYIRRKGEPYLTLPYKAQAESGISPLRRNSNRKPYGIRKFLYADRARSAVVVKTANSTFQEQVTTSRAVIGRYTRLGLLGILLRRPWCYTIAPDIFGEYAAKSYEGDDEKLIEELVEGVLLKKDVLTGPQLITHPAPVMEKEGVGRFKLVNGEGHIREKALVQDSIERLKERFRSFEKIVLIPGETSSSQRLTTSTILHKINQKFVGHDRIDIDDSYYDIKFSNPNFNDNVKTYFFEKFRNYPIGSYRLTYLIAAALAREGQHKRMRKVFYEIDKVVKFNMGERVSEVFDSLLSNLRPEYANYLFVKGRRREFMPRPITFHQSVLLSLRFFKKKLRSTDSRNASGKSLKLAVLNEIENHFAEYKAKNTFFEEYNKLSGQNSFLITGAVMQRKKLNEERLAAYEKLIKKERENIKQVPTFWRKTRVSPINVLRKKAIYKKVAYIYRTKLKNKLYGSRATPMLHKFKKIAPRPRFKKNLASARIVKKNSV